MKRLIIALAIADALTAQNRYECRRASAPPRIDGKLNDPAWKRAPWTEWFVDIEGSNKPKPRFKTRAKILWDNRALYIGAELEEPDVWATLTEHDSVIFHDNDFEVFIDPHGKGLGYFEFEINALNTSWDLRLDKPYKDGGKPDNSWSIPGLESAVSVRGTLNDARDRDRGWSVEIAMPWGAFGERPLIDGTWRINFSRVEWKIQVIDGRYRVVPGTKEDNWVWSPQGRIDMHWPEYWGVVRFVR
jgi:hypothetical protein